MKVFEAIAAVNRKNDTMSYRMALLSNKSELSMKVLDILDIYPENHILSGKDLEIVNQYLNS